MYHCVLSLSLSRFPRITQHRSRSPCSIRLVLVLSPPPRASVYATRVCEMSDDPGAELGAFARARTDNYRDSSIPNVNARRERDSTRPRRASSAAKRPPLRETSLLRGRRRAIFPVLLLARPRHRGEILKSCRDRCHARYLMSTCVRALGLGLTRSLYTSTSAAP